MSGARWECWGEQSYRLCPRATLCIEFKGKLCHFFFLKPLRDVFVLFPFQIGIWEAEWGVLNLGPGQFTLICGGKRVFFWAQCLLGLTACTATIIRAQMERMWGSRTQAIKETKQGGRGEKNNLLRIRDLGKLLLSSVQLDESLYLSECVTIEKLGLRKRKWIA